MPSRWSEHCLRVSCPVLLCGCFWLVVVKQGDVLVLCQSASGRSTVSPKAGHHGGSVPPRTNYQTSILADFAGKGFGKNGPVQATEVRLFSSRSLRTVRAPSFCLPQISPSLCSIKAFLPPHTQAPKEQQLRSGCGLSFSSQSVRKGPSGPSRKALMCAGQQMGRELTSLPLSGCSLVQVKSPADKSHCDTPHNSQ